MKRTVSVLVVLVAALCIARPSQAQNAPAAPSAPAATPPAPPPNYPPPPPRYPSSGGYGNPPPSYWAPAPQRQWYDPEVTGGVFRPFSFTLGVGPGFLHGPEDANEVGLSYNLFRIGIGVIPNLQFVLAFEGMGANTTSRLTGEYSWLHQENWLVGVQWHVLRRLYLRGEVGAGFIGERTDTVSIPGPGTGLATAAGIGYEFVQTPHISLALDANASLTKYAAKEYWTTTGLNLAVTFY
jgi:hypothetical protein